jgi:hypothetical protein
MNVYELKEMYRDYNDNLKIYIDQVCVSRLRV